MSSCVLCGVDIVKNTDKNLVDGRRGNSFKVREELLSLECKVEINSTNICRNCLCALKFCERKSLLTIYAKSFLNKIINGKSQTLLSNFFVERGGCTQAMVLSAISIHGYLALFSFTVTIPF